MCMAFKLIKVKNNTFTLFIMNSKTHYFVCLFYAGQFYELYENPR